MGCGEIEMTPDLQSLLSRALEALAKLLTTEF